MRKKKVTTTVKEIEIMRTPNIQHKTKFAALFIAGALAWLTSSAVHAQTAQPPAVQAQANGFDNGWSIVGLWRLRYISKVGGPGFKTYQQYHSDGLEIETPSFLYAVCMGTFTQIDPSTYKLYHVGWTPGGIPGHADSVRFELREINTLPDRNHFNGTYDQKYFDGKGIVVAEDSGTIQATRLTVGNY